MPLRSLEPLQRHLVITAAQRLQGKRILDGKGHARVGELLRDQLRLSQQTFRIKAAGSLAA